MRRDKLPASMQEGKKTGFDIPAHEWLRGPLRSMLVYSLREGIAEYGQLFREYSIENFLTRHLERKANVGNHLSYLIVLFQSMKRRRFAPKPSSTTQSYYD